MKKIHLLCALASIQILPAITIQIDYTYDTTNFFNTQAKRDAIQAVANFYGDMIQDTLLRIDAADFPGCSWTARHFHPATGAIADIPNLVVPANTLIIYVGARDLGGSTLGTAGPGFFAASSVNSGWFPLLRGRGNPGAATATDAKKTDFAPWGGSISFDVDSTWNFSSNQNLAGSEFISIALHEMAHVLGIGTAPAWTNKISAGTFSGAACARSYGSAPAMHTDNSHFNSSVPNHKAFGSFGVSHGSARPVVMRPVLNDNGSTFVVATDLDLAALVDIGWQVRPPQALAYSALAPDGAAFTWKSSSFYDYKVQRSVDLTSFPGGNTQAAGTGLVQSWTDPAPPTATAFYRLAATIAVPAPTAPLPALPPSQTIPLSFESEVPRVVTCFH